MPFFVSSSIDYHHVKKIEASTHGNGVLRITLHGDPDVSGFQFNSSEIIVFLDDRELVNRLITGINGPHGIGATALKWIVENPNAHPANMVTVAKDALKDISI